LQISDAVVSVNVVRRTSSTFSLAAQFEVGLGFTMVLGPSGSGKTTLLDCIAGLARPDAGRIAIGERVLFDAAAQIDIPVAQRRLAYLFQSLALFPHLSVEQNVKYGIAKLAAPERERRMRSLLESFRITQLRDRRPGEISGGERQRVALARALVTDPVLLLLDEPLTALDLSTKSKILEDLRQWNAAHRIPVLYVTHDPQEAFALGERVLVLEAGQLIAQGMPQQILKWPRSETIAQIVGFENVFDATVVSLMEAQGTMLCRVGRNHLLLEVPLTGTTVGAPVRIAVRAGDIMLAGERPHGLSARNTFAGRVIEVRRAGVTVVVMVDSGVTLEVHVTLAAAEELKLAPQRPVWLVLKTNSCSLVER
jgi:molybdate transport system ATP-binding protein